MAEQQGWIITTSPDRAIKDIASDLNKAGFTVNHVLEQVGTITGTATADSLATLRAIPGVVAISPDRPIAIGPPDADSW